MGACFRRQPFLATARTWRPAFPAALAPLHEAKPAGEPRVAVGLQDTRTVRRNAASWGNAPRHGRVRLALRERLAKAEFGQRARKVWRPPV